MSVPEIQLRAIAVEETYILRQRILRPQQSIEACKYPYDFAAESYHLGCFKQTHLVGVGSILPDARAHTTAPFSWRIRGMAVLHEARGMGLGSQILKALIAHASTRPGEIWCNGRVDAKNFYARQGFAAHGEIFETPPTGPHLLFIRAST